LYDTCRAKAKEELRAIMARVLNRHTPNEDTRKEKRRAKILDQEFGKAGLLPPGGRAIVEFFRIVTYAVKKRNGRHSSIQLCSIA